MVPFGNSIPFILVLIASVYLLAKNKERFMDRDFFNRFIVGLFFFGLLLSFSHELPAFLIDSNWYNPATSVRPIILFLIPALIATLIYNRFRELNDVEMSALIIWGVLSLLTGMFLAFFMTMDNPAIPYDGPADYSRYGWILKTALTNMTVFALNAVVLSIPYTLHSRTKNMTLSILLTLAIGALPVIYAYVFFYVKVLGLL